MLNLDCIKCGDPADDEMKKEIDEFINVVGEKFGAVVFKGRICAQCRAKDLVAARAQTPSAGLDSIN